MSAKTYYLTLQVTAKGAEILNAKIVKGLREVRQEAKETSDTFTAWFSKSSYAMRRFFFGLQISLFYMNMFYSSQIMLETSQMRLEDAQRSYNEALREHGYGSEEAIDAARRLEYAQKSLEKAQVTNMLNTAGMTIQMMSLSAQMIDLVSKSKAMSGILDMLKLKEYAYSLALMARAKAQAIVNALTGNWVSIAAALAAGAAIGGLGAYALTSANAQPASTNITIEGSEIAVTDDVERALEEDKQRKLEAIRRIR